MREIVELIRCDLPYFENKNIIYKFSTVFKNSLNEWNKREIAQVHNLKRGNDDFIQI
jgi:hypothetical protein